jgi:hypothetical protein
MELDRVLIGVTVENSEDEVENRVDDRFRVKESTRLEDLENKLKN